MPTQETITGLSMLNKFHPISHLLLGKVIEKVVALQLWRILEETDYLDPFQSCFRPRNRPETALVTLMDDVWWKQDGGSASILALLTSQQFSIPSTMVSFWAILRSWVRRHSFVLFPLPPRPVPIGGDRKWKVQLMAPLWCATGLGAPFQHLHEITGWNHPSPWNEILLPNYWYQIIYLHCPFLMKWVL